MPEITFNIEFRNQRFEDAAKGLKYFSQALEKDWDGAAKKLSVELRAFLDLVSTAIIQRNSNPWPGGTTGTSLSLRSGRSMQSIKDSIKVSGATFDTITGEIGGAWPLAVHEYGATINAKSKLLTIPLPAALDSRGIPLKKSARDWDNTFVAKSKAGNLLIFQKRGSQIVPLYVLKSQVVIKPRLKMRDTINAGIPYFVDKAVDAIVKSIIKK